MKNSIFNPFKGPVILSDPCPMFPVVDLIEILIKHLSSVKGKK